MLFIIHVYYMRLSYMTTEIEKKYDNQLTGEN
jgi:hypothetical protein